MNKDLCSMKIGRQNKKSVTKYLKSWLIMNMDYDNKFCIFKKIRLEISDFTSFWFFAFLHLLYKFIFYREPCQMTNSFWILELQYLNVESATIVHITFIVLKYYIRIHI